MSNKRLTKDEIVLLPAIKDVKAESVQKALKGEKLKNVEVDEVRSYLSSLTDEEVGACLAEQGLDEEVTDGASGAEEDAQTKSTKSVIPAEIKKAYGPQANCGDEVAVALDGFDIDQCKKLAKQLSIAWNWSHLNVGMQRMNFGNRVRKQFKAEDGKDFAKRFKAEVKNLIG